MSDDTARTYAEEGAKPECWEDSPQHDRATCSECGKALNWRCVVCGMRNEHAHGCIVGDFEQLQASRRAERVAELHARVAELEAGYKQILTSKNCSPQGGSFWEEALFYIKQIAEQALSQAGQEGGAEKPTSAPPGCVWSQDGSGKWICHEDPAIVAAREGREEPLGPPSSIEEVPYP